MDHRTSDSKFKQRKNLVYRRQLLKNETPAENAFRILLQRKGIRFIQQKGFIKGNYHCITDFYLPRPFKTAIEIDGPYHKSAKQKEKDKRKERYLKIIHSTEVIRFSNNEVLKTPQLVWIHLLQFLKRKKSKFSSLQPSILK